MKPRPSDEEFEQLKRHRDEDIRATVKAICEKHGWDPNEVSVHSPDMGGCYCGCPDGPCQHIWDGPQYDSEDGLMFSATCSRCGAVAAYHDMRCAQ